LAARGIDVVERGACGHHIERGQLERVREHVGAEERGPVQSMRVGAGAFDAGVIRIDSDDVEPTAVRSNDNSPFAAADIERCRPNTTARGQRARRSK
jgi:hypothetical protein